MTYEKVFADLKKTMLKAETGKLEGEFAFQCVIEGDGEGTFYFALKNGEFTVEPYDYVGATATFKATAETYKNILTGKTTVDDAIAAGALEVDKPVSYADILTFFAKKPARKTAANKEAAPKAEKKTAAPKAEKKAAAPKAEKKTAAPKAEKKAAAPKTEKKTAAPKTEKKAAAPKTEKKAPAKKTAKK